MEIFDSHAHYDEPDFDIDRDELLGVTLPAAGVCGIVTAGTTVESSRSSAALAEKYSYIYFAAGIHPEDAESAKEGDLELITEILKGSKKGVAVGEIGLDYHCEVEKELQKRLFEQQLALAIRLDLPVIIHDRDAHSDTIKIIRRFRPRGVIHCFSGSPESAKELVSLGFYIGFTGSVTFKNNKKSVKVLEAVPLDRILVETDCPFMAPEPFRGKRSDSSMIARSLSFIAQIKGVSPEEISHITAQNARRFFDIKELNA